MELSKETLVKAINNCYTVSMLYDLNADKAEYCVSEIADAVLLLLSKARDNKEGEQK